MSEERKVFKDEKGMFILEINNKEANLFQRKKYSKQEMKNNYDSIITQLRMHHEQVGKLKNNLKVAPEYTSDEEKVRVIVQKVLLNQQFEKLNTDLARVTEEIELFEAQKKEIENIIPEFKRNK